MTIQKGVERKVGRVHDKWSLWRGTPATLTVGELFPLCQHTAHRAEVILPFYDLLYLASVLALETVYSGDQLYIPRLPFSSALRSVKYSTVYYHFIWLQFFPLTVVQGSLDSESLPLSNSICLNVKKKKKKSRTLYDPSNLAFLRKYLIGVAFLKLYLLEAGAGRGDTWGWKYCYFQSSLFRKSDILFLKAPVTKTEAVLT